MQPDVCVLSPSGVPSRPCQVKLGAVALLVVRKPGGWSRRSGRDVVVERVPWTEIRTVRVESTGHRPFGRDMQKLIVEWSRGVLELLMAPEALSDLMPHLRWQTQGRPKRRSRPRSVAHGRVAHAGHRRRRRPVGATWLEAAFVLVLDLAARAIRWTGYAFVAALNVAILFGGGVLLLTSTAGVSAAGTPFGIGNNGVFTSSVSHLIDTETAADQMALPPATQAPTPLPAANETPLPSHQVFGFAPYWTLGQSSAFDVAGLTTIAYFSVDVNANGSLDEGGPGWNGLQSQALASLVSRAHAADDRVVLTVTCFDQGTLDQVTADPSAPATLAAALIPLLESKGLDGVNLDFEGTGSQDQAGLTNLVASVSTALRSADPDWQVTMDTYASSASSNAGFYNIGALAPYVDAFFVMSYSLNLDANPSAGSPLTSQMFSDLTAINEYLAVVPADKVILGLPYFGYDWPTAGPNLGAAAVGGGTALAVSQIAGSGAPLYWDSTTDTAWTSYQVGSQWHQAYFDNANSLYLAAQLASSYSLAGDGIWALGMDGNDSTMLAAVDGSAPPVKDLPAGPPPSTTTTVTSPPTSTSSGSGPTTSTTLPNPLSVATGSGSPPGTAVPVPPPGSTTTTQPAYTYFGDVNGTQVRLTLAGWPGLTDTQEPQPAGELTGFTTNDPAYQCLEAASELVINTYADRPGLDLVVATAPADCASVEFFFPSSVLESG